VYESHYGLQEKPFSLTPDPKYLYLSQRHGEAFAHLLFAHRERGGFVVITGEVGAGKTTLARSFLAKLGPETATAVVLYPKLSAGELLRSILQDLHVPDPGVSLKDAVDALHRFLLEARSQGREVVLLIDEAQNLSAELLEQIRLLSNLETEKDKLIHIVLMGQSELHDLLARHELRQLAQRVTARYHLGALGPAETEDYVRHRLEVAGGAGRVTFTREALRAVQRASGGIPRLVNLICDRALLGGYARGTREIDLGLVREAAREVVPPAPTGRRRIRRMALVAGASAAVALLASGALLFQGFDPPKQAAPLPVVTPSASPASLAPSLLEPLLLTLAHDASLEAATGDLAELWGPGPLERTWVRTQLAQLRQLGLPAVLELFHPARRETGFATLQRLTGDGATLSLPGQAPIEVGTAELERLWTHQALLLWRDHFGLMQAGSAAATAPFTLDTLRAQGYATASEADPAAAIASFQRALGLWPDGVVGERTLLALYSQGRTDGPRLGGSSQP